jgi:hypothetical protein
LAATLALASACSNEASKTDLLSQYPPFIMQVLIDEAFTDATGNSGTRRVFGFGVHPQATPDEEHAVMTAVAGNTGGGVHLRIIVSKLLLGNSLQEIACRAPVSAEGAWDHVPLGATPDDIAACSAQDQGVLDESCHGPKAVCLCQIAGGCGAVPVGGAVGILDQNMDGAADAQRLIPGSVGLTCDNIAIPINLNDFDVSNGISGVPGSYYDPSGFQQPPAAGGFEAMGPAIVLVPGKIVTGVVMNNPLPILPTSATCHLTMNGVTDKTNTDPCAPVLKPPAGQSTCPDDTECVNLDAPCPQGDLSAFTFGTEPIVVTLQGIGDNSTGVARGPIIAQTNDSVVLDPGSVGNITMTQAGQPFTAFTVAIDPNTGTFVTVTPNAGTFLANTLYTITFQTNFNDAFGKGPAAPITYHFTTGA